MSSPKKMILEFPSMQAREDYIAKAKLNKFHRYRRAPWLAVEVDENEIATMKKEEGVKILEDLKFQPVLQE